MCRVQLLTNALTAALLPLHVEQPYARFLNMHDVVLSGPRAALVKANHNCQCSLDQKAKRAGVYSRISAWSQAFLGRGRGPTLPALDVDSTLAMSRRHAVLLLQASTTSSELQHVLGTPLMQEVIRAAGDESCHTLINLKERSAFGRTRSGVLLYSSLGLRASFMLLVACKHGHCVHLTCTMELVNACNCQFQESRNTVC